MAKREHFASLLAALSLTLCAYGCAEELTIGNASLDASNKQDGAIVGLDGGEALPDAGLPFEAGSAQDAGAFDAYIDINDQILLAASHALGGARWLSPAIATVGVGSIQFAFQPAVGHAEGMFIVYCPSGCPFEMARDAGAGAGRPSGSWTQDTYNGRYVLSYVNSDGIVFGSLFTEDGTLNLGLQIDWGVHPRATPLDQVLIAFSPVLFGRLAFVPLRN